jgi:hypothetical protein
MKSIGTGRLADVKNDTWLLNSILHRAEQPFIRRAALVLDR